MWKQSDPFLHSKLEASWGYNSSYVNQSISENNKQIQRSSEIVNGNARSPLHPQPKQTLPCVSCWKRQGCKHLGPHAHTYTHIHIYIRTDTHRHTYTHVHIHTFTYIHTHIHINTYINTYRHIHIRTHFLKICKLLLTKRSLTFK